MKANKKTKILILVFMLAVLLTGCARTTAASSWPGYVISDDAVYVSYAAQTYAINTSNGSLIWQYPAEADRSRQAYAAPAVGEEIVVFGDYNGNLVAVDAAKGTTKWEFSGAGNRYIGAAAIVNGMVYAPNTDDYLYVFDTQGDLQWKFKAEGPNWTQPVANDDTVFFVSMDHTLYAFDQAFDSSGLGMADDGSKTLRVDVKWTADLGMAVVADPVLDAGTLYVATIEGKLFAVDASNGNIKWSFNNGGDLDSIWGKPVVSENVVFFSDVDGNVYTLDKETGQQKWPSAFAAGSKIVGGGILTTDGAVFATEEGKLFLISSEKEPKTITSFENAIYSPLGLDGDNIIVAPVGGESLITEIDPNGFEVWSFMPSE